MANNSIIKLKNVSKFYYNKGIIASGFNKVNLEFKMGEFVAITGESGSGKSTLLNVISGLDTYEEGEMYINGLETSHYGEKEFEDYRRKYISNIFQTFNLVNSYTVYQNIELVLLLNGNKKKDVKDKVIELIKKVDLYKFRNTKVSKLSGGQKQRVAIARALAKDTPIIIADEPTGNLDSKSSKSIIKLLSEVSHDKLVIVVTHNYEQVEEYVTRKIKMHDGRVLEDKVIKKIDEVTNIKQTDYRNIRLFSKIRLGIRNTFNIVPKFLLLLSVFLFVTWALMIEYAAFKKLEYEESINGFNYLFNDTSDKRIIIKKNNKEAFTDNDYNDINNISNVDYVVKNDLLIDSTVNLNSSDYWLYGGVNLITNINKIDIGRMPSNDNEIVFETSTFLYSEEEIKKYILDKEFKLTSDYSGVSEEGLSLKIVGVKYNDNMFKSTFYVSEKTLNVFNIQVNRQYSDTKVLFKDNYYTMDTGNYVVPTYKVSPGYVYITEDMNYLCKNYNCVNQDIKIEVSNKYYKDSYTGKVKTYNKNNFKKLFGMNYDDLSGAFLVSMEDYNKLFDKNNFQSSVYVKDVKKIDDTVNELNNKGYSTLKITDALVHSKISEVIQIFRTIVTIILVVVLFFISYFVIKLILKSRNYYYTMIRTLGGNKKVSRELLVIELINIANIAYFTLLVLTYLYNKHIISWKFMGLIKENLVFRDYIVLYIILVLTSLLISLRYSRKLFKKSVMKTLVEEV